MENQKKLNSTNKLIANFYCNKYTNYVGTNIRYKWQFDIIDSKYKNVWYEEKNLKFNTSWNWLMPCLSKIDELEYELPEDSNLIGDISCALLNIDIESTYDAVVEFIKFYNKNT